MLTARGATTLGQFQGKAALEIVIGAGGAEGPVLVIFVPGITVAGLVSPVTKLFPLAKRLKPPLPTLY